MWVYVRHDRTQIDWRLETAESDDASKQLLQSEFGIDFARVDAWRDNNALRRSEGRPDLHPGLSSGEQHDCYFQIAALNRQIAILEQKQRQEGFNNEDECLIIEQRGARLKLLERLRQQGQQVFQ